MVVSVAFSYLGCFICAQVGCDLDNRLVHAHIPGSCCHFFGFRCPSNLVL